MIQKSTITSPCGFVIILYILTIYLIHCSQDKLSYICIWLLLPDNLAMLQQAVAFSWSQNDHKETQNQFWIGIGIVILVLMLIAHKAERNFGSGGEMLRWCYHTNKQLSICSLPTLINPQDIAGPTKLLPTGHVT